MLSERRSLRDFPPATHPPKCDSNNETDCRHFELPAEILKQMGVPAVRLTTNNSPKIEALELARVKVVEPSPPKSPQSPNNERYLQTKRKKMGHLVS